ncbi:type II toxin-antitoxin system RelE/ParE family toxin [Maribacter litopenaei]|uniref:Type II toxin-antitoxin system RelE/ParE family toxin n=1 Tax=Maribacter litopenaei TaxID=2976127 RepID=A0ABY5YD30_9FLAO|nr:type II toxin-antitoxin system RelE/ParE family toxin [Maribacter litopenaei]UWX55786.1 type II toxin-antitoxin system RelE/ParE family toxin [Maribacter litopenaei]
MPENNYVISAKARDDFKSIAKYTVEKFGETQSLKYAKGLKSVLTELGDNPNLVGDMWP